MQVYVVTSGEYSDYGIDTIFSTKVVYDSIAKYKAEKEGV